MKKRTLLLILVAVLLVLAAAAAFAILYTNHQDSEPESLPDFDSLWTEPIATVVSQGRQDPHKGTMIDPTLMGKVLRVEDQVGGWFQFVVPEDGDYHFSVLGPDIPYDEYSIWPYEYDSAGNHVSLGALFYTPSDTVQTRTIYGLKAGMTIAWWNCKPNRSSTLQTPFEMMITYTPAER